MRRPLFLRWAVLNSVVVTILAALGLAYSGRLTGASLLAVPVILAVLAGASGYAGLLVWRLEAPWSGTNSRGLRDAQMRDGLPHLFFAAGVCQLLGLLGTVAGFYAMFNEHGGDLATRVTHGAGVALSATFLGIFSSIVILLEHHVLSER